MRAAIVISAGMPHHIEWCGAMSRGLRSVGIECVVVSGGPFINVDFAVCWGWRIGREIVASGLDTLIMEAGHVGDRERWASCGWNGLQGRATYAPADDGERWRDHFGDMLKPWRGGGGYALLLGQCEGDMSLADMAVGYEDWATTITDCLISQGRRVVYRPHPLAGSGFCPRGATGQRGTLEEALEGAEMAVTYNSTSSVQAVLSGVPTVTLDAGAMAWPVSAHRLDGPLIRPDREAWAAWLAWTQYTKPEIENGQAWANVANAVRGGFQQTG